MKKMFTLIELMVVIAIIAILMSLLLPSLGKARKKSQQVVCTNTMKQMNTALHIYTTDNDRRFVFGAKLNNGMWTWDDELINYLGHEVPDNDKGGGRIRISNHPEIVARNPLKCPTDDMDRGSADNIPRSYTYNLTDGGLYDFAGLGNKETHGSKVAFIAKPSSTMALFEPARDNNRFIGKNGGSAFNYRHIPGYTLNDSHGKVYYFLGSFVDGSSRLIHYDFLRASTLRNPAITN